VLTGGITIGAIVIPKSTTTTITTINIAKTGMIKLTTGIARLIIGAIMETILTVTTTGVEVRPITIRGFLLRVQVDGNTIQPIAETRRMAIAMLPTGLDKVTIGFPAARVIAHSSQQQHVLATN
jgi:hypothetical protein